MTTTTFALTTPISVNARIGHGSFTLTAVDGVDEARVTLNARSERSDVLARTVVEMRGTTLHVTSPRQGGIFDLFGGNARDAIDVEITVPSATPVKASTFTADVTITGRCGNADIATGAAEVRIEHVDGDLRLRYGSGGCRVDHVTGSVQARSGAGDAHFGEIGGALSAACGSGRLEVTEVHGAVRSRAGSGDAAFGAVYANVDLASGSGELSIGIPAGVSARLDLTSGSGHVDSELPIATTPASHSAAITIRARTGHGDVRLFRAA